MARYFRKVRVMREPAGLLPIGMSCISSAGVFEENYLLRVDNVLWILPVHFDSVVKDKLLSKVSHQASFNWPHISVNVFMGFLLEILHMAKMNKFKELGKYLLVLMSIQFEFIVNNLVSIVR